MIDIIDDGQSAGSNRHVFSVGRYDIHVGRIVPSSSSEYIFAPSSGLQGFTMDELIVIAAKLSELNKPIKRPVEDMTSKPRHIEL